ncbi:SGNH/GDSL hydrolase family protein [Agromyces albus]|uniref:SGNH/GDSL hydrolase family protein n=1 Tax=Agromyces albus TaxID=205332 RepID=A0A4Q2KP12_9MICO|nr:SGNH/GDSL hydrolase family protein [Agromyces albus]RXZ67114.1 SGNH/GDSL hydrolase family protein [Agromyces albus]RXZ72148.1 SGNH/GDSL hydrolase family protein [Agromyces albus]
MTTTSRIRRQMSILGATALILATALVGAVPAQAVPGGPTQTAATSKVAYAALGDSYAAGVGGGGYLDTCLTSPAGYPSLLSADPGVRHVALLACSGATTADVTTQLSALTRQTKLITITVGGNDLGVDVLASACVAGTVDDCFAAVAVAQARLPQLAADLASTFAAIGAAAPKATVVVTGYPLLFESPTDPRKVAVNQGIMLLNDLIEATATGAGFLFVDVESAFAGHGLDSADPWIHGLASPEAFHPTVAGYEAYAAAIRAAIG